MHTASISAISLDGKPSILNLFAYIRDLYQTSDPQKFEESSHTSWQLSDWAKYSKGNLENFHFDLLEKDGPLLRINHHEVPDLITPDAIKEWVVILEGEKNDRPVLAHRKERIEKFESDPEREKAFHLFSEEVQGQSLHRIANKEIPAILRDWIEVEVKEEKVFIKRKDKTTVFESDDLRVQMFQAYSRVFNQYYDENWYSGQINQLFQDLHQLHFELKAHPQKQLFLSFGLLLAKVNGKTYSHYLYHIPLNLKLVQQSLHINGSFDKAIVSCNPGFVNWLDEHFDGESSNIINGRKKEVLAKADQFNHKRKRFSFEQDQLKEEFYKPALEMISVFPQVQDHFFAGGGENLNLDFLHEDSKDGISFSFSPLIQVRQSDDQFLISRDATAILKKLDQLIEKEETHKIPDFFNKLFDLPGNRNSSGQESIIKKTKTKTNFLFPLPYNKEQLSIAKKLEDQDAITVMGPPGTGKSHTIANITSHYVAQGKSVLIVSKNSKALEVVKAKLPRPIQDLSVSLQGEGGFDESVKHTIDNVKDRLGRNYNWDDIIKIENQLEETQKAYKRIIGQIRLRIEQNDEVKSFFNPITGKEETRSISDWAEYLQELGIQILFIKDEINHKQPTDGLPYLLAQYIELTAGFPPEAHNLVKHKFPDFKEWLKPEEFQHICDRLDALSSIIDIQAYKGHEPKALTPELKKSLNEVKNDLHVLNETGRITKHPLFKQHILRDLFDRNVSHFQLLENPVSDHSVDLGELKNTDPEILLKEIHLLMEKFSGSQTIGFVKRKTLSPNAKKFFECKVDGILVKNLNQLGILEAYLSRAFSIKRLKIVLKNYFNSLGISFDEDQLLPTLNLMKEVLQALANIEELNLNLKKKALPIINYTSNEVDKTLNFLLNIKFFQIYQDHSQKIQTGINQIGASINTDTSPVVNSLLEALKDRDPDRYNSELEALKNQKILVERVKESEQFYEDLRKVLPLTADHLRNRIQGDMAKMEIPRDSLHEQLASECFASKLIDYLDSVSATVGEIPRLFKELHQLQKLKEEWTGKLVALQTWHFKSQSITDQERSALTAWRNDLINIGKGHGKNTQRNLKSAIHNMRIASKAIPIWIMQQETAITFFPDPEPQQFDLLIIDEASQCDISMMNLIFRAKKCMIVGDENQTSVVTKASVFPIERTNQILDRYLHNHPFRQQFNINNRTASIYTLSGVIYPNIVSLTEHFRCRPEIIGFSNKYVYNQQITPLKTAKASIWGRPVEEVYVEDQGNGKRKTVIIEAILARIEHYIDLFESGESNILPSVGILCLESSNETHIESLIRSLSRNERIRKYEEQLQLLVGTSRKFQGDERDIMLLSCTASSSIGKNGKIRPPRAVMGEELQRIYNVAASRAKEISVLFHSIHPDAVASMNPNCLRKKLIEYYRDTRASNIGITDFNKLMDATQSIPGSFKQEVCSFLYEEGLSGKIFPQYEIGKIIIDFAILEDGKNLAVLCDGEGSAMYAQELINQQLILERVGWGVIRISRLQWYRKSEEIREEIKYWLNNELE